MIKSSLNNLSQKQLVDLIIRLYKKSPENKELIDSIFDTTVIDCAYKKYKQQILQEFYPKKGLPKIRFSVMRSAIKKFKDISNNTQLIAELMYLIVITGTKFCKEWGMDYEEYYNSLLSMFKTLLKHLEKSNLIGAFQQECNEIVRLSEDTGWGYHDDLTSIYEEYFE